MSEHPEGVDPSVLPLPEALDSSLWSRLETNTHDTTISRADDEDPADVPSVVVEPSHPAFETAQDPRIPDGPSHFKIGAVARIVGVKPYVLRYWESAFPWVEPDKTDSGQRRYRREDVAVLLQIRRLLHDEKLTVARTKKLLEDSRRTGRPLHLPGSEISVPVHAEAMDRATIQRRIASLRRSVRTLLELVED